MAMLCAWFCGTFTTGFAQSTSNAHQDTITHLLRIFEDNDFINIWGKGTDDAYTNGTRIDYFYRPRKHPHGVDRWMPAAGDSTTDVYGWGVFQIMYTPDDITDRDYQPNDYPWSGELIATHSRYSYNPVKHYDLQTELVLGVIGPAAMNRQVQSMVHHLINYFQPAGWGHQYRNDLLANVNLTAEKELVSLGSMVTVIGGAQVYAGTMQNGAALYPLILIGKKQPYFNGFLSQYTSPGQRGKKQWQAYLLFRPEMQYFLTNAVLQGGLFTTNPNLQQPARQPDSKSVTPQPYHPLQPWVGSFAFGAVLTHGRTGISFTQTATAATLKGLYCHTVGNFSLYFGW
jgi:lipid A 3-O-deacylase